MSCAWVLVRVGAEPTLRAMRQATWRSRDTGCIIVSSTLAKWRAPPPLGDMDSQ